MRVAPRCQHYSFRLAARVILHATSHRQDSTYHGLCYTSHGALAGTRNSSMGPPWRIDLVHHTISERSYHRATSRSPWRIDPTTHPTMSECSYHRATSHSHNLCKFYFKSTVPYCTCTNVYNHTWSRESMYWKKRQLTPITKLLY